MTIQQCRYVLEIARSGSFSKAAKQLFIAQSSLSVSVKTLEQELGIQIFDRSGNGASLTDAGAEFIQYAKQICENSDFVAERYSSRHIQQKLYIATQHYDFVADIFGKMLQQTNSDSYRFSIREIETYNVIRSVETAYSDIGVIAIKESAMEIMRRYLNKRKLTFTSVLTVKPHVFFHQDHPLADRQRLTYEDLKQYPYVSYEQGEHNSSYFTEELTDNAYIDKHIEISDRATLMNVLLITDAYTVGTGIMPSALNKGDIVSVPLDSPEQYVIGYILSDERSVSEMTKQFIENMEAALHREE